MRFRARFSDVAGDIPDVRGTGSLCRILPMAALTCVAVAGCALSGSDGGTATVDGEIRIVEIEMADTAFRPVSIDVRRGETVRFMFHNSGAVAHDAFIGDADAQVDHERVMREAEQGSHGGGHGGSSTEHGGADAITVEPDDSGQLIHAFEKVGTYEIGCHQPGHYDAGMRVTVEVA